MKKDGFFAEALSAIVNQHKKRARQNSPNLFLDQKKQLWYLLMSAVDDEPSAPPEREQDAPPEA